VRSVLMAAKGGDVRAVAAAVAREEGPAGAPGPARDHGPHDIVAALGPVTDAVTAGELSPEEGADVVGIPCGGRWRRRSWRADCDLEQSRETST
jgi:hypothetical protein